MDRLTFPFPCESRDLSFTVAYPALRLIKHVLNEEKLQGRQGLSILMEKRQKVDITHDTNQINDTGKVYLGQERRECYCFTPEMFSSRVQ